MVTRRAFLTLLGSAGVAGTGIVAGAKLLPAEDAEGNGEPVIRYGEEACDRCGMVIDDSRFAAAWSDGGGEMHFDDIGCAALKAAEQGLRAEARVFVSDFSTERWQDAHTAGYVHTSSVRTPMAYGIVAVADATAAHSLAEKLHGEVLRWEDVPGRLEQMSEGQPHGHGQGHR